MPPDKVKAAEAFQDFVVTHGRWVLDWGYIGEGNSGDFNPDDPEDMPRLRATLNCDGEPVDKGSYCTLASPFVERWKLEQSALALMRAFEIHGFSKRAMEEWTWTTY